MSLRKTAEAEKKNQINFVFSRLNKTENRIILYYTKCVYAHCKQKKKRYNTIGWTKNHNKGTIKFDGDRIAIALILGDKYFYKIIKMSMFIAWFETIRLFIYYVNNILAYWYSGNNH